MKLYFSVILPTYNRAFCIEKAIDSLINQSYKNYELIIVDDGSTDQTENILKEKYKEYFDSHKFIYKKLKRNKGVCCARNEGLKLTNYEWIVYLDSDNKMLPFFLEEYAKAIPSNPNKKIFYSQIHHSNGRVIGKAFDYNQLLKANYIDLGVFVHHKSLIKKYGKFDTKLKRLVDWDLIIRYTKKETPYFIEKILLEYSGQDDYPRITNTESLELAKKHIYRKHIQKLSLFEKILSVKNRGIHKIITFMGIKLKIKSKKLALQQTVYSLNKIISSKNTEIKKLNNKYNALKEQTYCPICNSYNTLKTGGTNKRVKAVCSKCGSFERHRFLYFIYNFLFLNSSKNIKVLHIAPEKSIYELIKRNSNIEYVAMDLEPERFTFLDNCTKGDVRKMPFADKCFDVIIHNQVIEHIDDEKQFIDESLRVLKDDGCMIINIPYSPYLEKTFESKNIVTEEDRKKHYYQEDHVRLYGNDMLKSYDYLSITRLDESIMTEDLIKKMQLKRDISNSMSLSDAYFIVRKK